MGGKTRRKTGGSVRRQLIEKLSTCRGCVDAGKTTPFHQKEMNTCMRGKKEEVNV